MDRPRGRLSMRVYLAGPCVFLPDPLARAATMKALCTQHGLAGISPLDPLDHEPSAWADIPEALRIARRNEAHIASCDALIANLTPFRGPSADAGTVFELGYMRALGRPVFGWTNTATPFAERSRSFAGVSANVDAEGLQIEDFGLADNLMIEAAILASGGILARDDCPAHQRWSRLNAFVACLSALAQRT